MTQHTTKTVTPMAAKPMVWMSAIAATILAAAVSAEPAFADAKNAAFGKELAQNEMTGKPEKSKSTGEIEDLDESEDKAPARRRRAARRGARGKQLNIQLDGAEDGGGGDLDGNF